VEAGVKAAQLEARLKAGKEDADDEEEEGDYDEEEEESQKKKKKIGKGGKFSPRRNQKLCSAFSPAQSDRERDLKQQLARATYKVKLTNNAVKRQREQSRYLQARDDRELLRLRCASSDSDF
jgi:hypothetical protein